LLKSFLGLIQYLRWLI